MEQWYILLVVKYTTECSTMLGDSILRPMSGMKWPQWTSIVMVWAWQFIVDIYMLQEVRLSQDFLRDSDTPSYLGYSPQQVHEGRGSACQVLPLPLTHGICSFHLKTLWSTKHECYQLCRSPWSILKCEMSAISSPYPTEGQENSWHFELVRLLFQKFPRHNLGIFSWTVCNNNFLD